MGDPEKHTEQLACLLDRRISFGFDKIVWIFDGIEGEQPCQAKNTGGALIGT